MEQKLKMGLLGKRKREEDKGAKGGQWGPSLLFNGRVNKSPVKLSGLQPRVFTALVSITNKSRIAPNNRAPTATAAAAAPLPRLPPFPLSCAGFIGNSKLRKHPSGCDHQL